FIGGAAKIKAPESSLLVRRIHSIRKAIPARLVLVGSAEPVQHDNVPKPVAPGGGSRLFGLDHPDGRRSFIDVNDEKNRFATVAVVAVSEDRLPAHRISGTYGNDDWSPQYVADVVSDLIGQGVVDAVDFPEEVVVAEGGIHAAGSVRYVKRKDTAPARASRAHQYGRPVPAIVGVGDRDRAVDEITVLELLVTPIGFGVGEQEVAHVAEHRLRDESEPLGSPRDAVHDAVVAHPSVEPVQHAVVGAGIHHDVAPRTFGG